MVKRLVQMIIFFFGGGHLGRVEPPHPTPLQMVDLLSSGRRPESCNTWLSCVGEFLEIPYSRFVEGHFNCDILGPRAHHNTYWFASMKLSRHS